MTKTLLLCLALCGNVSWATTILDSPPDYVTSETLDLGASDATSILDDSDLLSLGDAPGAFLVTANTDFDFTGDQILLFLEMDSSPVSAVSANLSFETTSPEPGTLPLSAAALMATVWTIRRSRLKYTLPL